jgi:hypothetical protein
MNRFFAIGLLILVAGAFAWWWRSGDEAPANAPAKTAAGASTALPVDSVLRVRPAQTASPGNAPTTPVKARPVSPLIAQYRAKRNFAALHAAVQGASTPEALYLRAEIYRTCARPEGKTAGDLARERAGDRDRFAAGLAQGVAGASQRLDAYDRLHADPCQGLDLGSFDPAELARLVAAAADAGDPRARAWQLAERIERSRFGNPANDATGYDVSAADFEQMRQLMSVADPEVVLDLQGVLASSMQHGSMRLNGEPVDQGSLYSALSLLACDLGASCGADAQTLLTNCAYRGRCATGSLYEYLYYYEASPASAQQIDNYRRAWLAMLNAGDLSGLTLSSVDAPPGFSMTFGGRRLFRPPGG